jgi:Endonuclease/Exonuclease/phosphatase family./Reverse transcriptase (RNA-dependent DNA polymerase).
MKEILVNTWKADILLLQETHCNSEKDWNDWCFEYKMVGSGSMTSHKSVGVAILVRPDYFEGMEFIIDKKEGQNGRSIYMKATRKGEKWLIACIYAPNKAKERIQFFQNLDFLNLALNDFDIIIFAGDLNTRLYEKDKFNIERKDEEPEHIDNLAQSEEETEHISHLAQLEEETEETSKVKVVKNNEKTRAKAKLQAIIFEYTLCDPYHLRDPETPHISWRNPQCTRGSRIDYILINQVLEPRVNHVHYLETGFTDHKACIMKIEEPNSIKRGHGFWKLNARLLKNKNWQEKLTAAIRTFKEDLTNKGSSIQGEELKQKIMIFSCKCGKELQKQYRRERKWIELCIQHYENLLIVSQDEASIRQAKEMCENYHKQLKDFYEIQCIGAGIRGRIKWIEDGEKPTKYFFKFEIISRANSIIVRLKDPETSQIFEVMGELANHIVQFYERLYKKTDSNKEAIKQFLKASKRRLTKQSKNMCDAPLTVYEIIQAIQHLRLNTSPGIDGITNEFYKQNIEEMAPILLDIYEDWFKKGELGNSQKMGIICLIYKKGDREDIQNYRPISLMCCDLKILTSILANRLQNCIQEIIHPDQSGFIRKRSIHDNIRLVTDLMEYTKRKGIIGGVLLLDQFKAFDLMNWDYMKSCVAHFGFGPIFIQWIEILYKDLKSQVIFNGHLTQTFKVERGVRQGDPLSPLLFDLGIEGLANVLRESITLQGIPLPLRDNMKVSMYADDTLVTFSSQADLNEIEAILQRYCIASGAKINKAKSEIILFQSDNTFPDLKGYTLKEYTKYLGIFIGRNIPPNLIWEPILKIVKMLISLWNRRNLSIQGRSLVAKTLLLSRFWYAATNQIVPKDVLDEIRKLTYDYIWQGKTAPICHEIASLSKERGGLKIMNVDLQIQALLSKWFQQLLSNSPQKWKSIVTWYLGEGENAMNIFKTNFDLSRLKLNLPIFWKEVCKIWTKLNISRINPPQKRIDFLEEPIYRNPLIQLEKGGVLLKENGIHTLKHLMVRDQLPRIDELNLISLNERVQKVIVQTLSILNYEWVEKLQFPSLNSDLDDIDGLIFILVDLNLSDNPNPSLTSTPLDQQFGFLDDQQNKILLNSMTVKHAYNRLLGKQLSSFSKSKKTLNRRRLPLLAPSQELIPSKWDRIWNIPNLLWEPLWLSCFDLQIPNKKKELSWRILHMAIPTLDNISKFKRVESSVSIPTLDSISKYRRKVSPICLFCKETVETISHLWYSCNTASLLWTWVERLISDDIDKEITLSEFNIMTNGYDLEIELELEFEKKQWRIMIFEVKWQIWLARNDAFWNNIPTITTLELLMKTKTAFKQQLTDFATLKKKDISINLDRRIKRILRTLEDKRLWAHIYLNVNSEVLEE